MDIHINYLAVLVAAVVYFFIGFLWYSVLFMKPYVKEMGLDKLNKKEHEAAKKRMGRSMAINFVANLLAAYCLAHLVLSGSSFYHTVSVTAGLQSGFWVFLGFIATSSLNRVIWGTDSLKLYLINSSYFLVSFLSMGAILALWQ